MFEQIFTWQIGAIALLVYLLLQLFKSVMSIYFHVDIANDKVKRIILPTLALILGAGLGAVSSLIDGELINKIILGAIAGGFSSYVWGLIKGLFKSKSTTIPPPSV